MFMISALYDRTLALEEIQEVLQTLPRLHNQNQLSKMGLAGVAFKEVSRSLSVANRLSFVFAFINYGMATD